MKGLLHFAYSVLMAGMLFFGQNAFAQTYNITGTVMDTKGQPVIGASVIVEGSTNGTIVDLDGKYKLSFQAKEGASPRLVFSCLTYKTETVEISNRSVIDVILNEDAEQLDEVVVVGYGSMKRSDLTGSVTSIKIEEAKASQSGSLVQLIQGHAAGVQVVSNNASPDSWSNVTIRGASSFNSNSQPLYVVDGVIMNTDTDVVTATHGGKDDGPDEATNGLMGISPQDIASMEVLKDASATAIYGSQGANGVILITTKSATREKPVVTFSAGVDISRITKKFDLLTTYNYTDFLDIKGTDPTSTAYMRYTDGLPNGKYSPVDWQDFATRTGIGQRYYFSIASRSKETNYRFSLAYNSNQGVIIKTGYKNLTARLNLDKKLGHFRIGTKTAFSFLESESTQNASGTHQSSAASMIMSMLTTKPLLFNEKTDEEGDEFDGSGAPISGPERWLTDFESTRTEFRVTPSAYLQYEILPWLTFKSTFGADVRATEQAKFKSNRISREAGSQGGVSNIDRFNWNWDNLFLINKSFGKHNVSGTLGQSAFSSSTKTQSIQGTQVNQWRALTNSLNGAPNVWESYSTSYYQILSFFARAVYNFDERYIITATYRFDGSSKFAGKNKWAQFPSAAFAWRLSQEPWFNVGFISSAKLRLGWGMVGNQGIPPYQTRILYTTGATSSHNESGKVVTANNNDLSNPDLKWETTSQSNIGIDLGLFKGRLTLTADAYLKTTKDLLQTLTVAGSAGIANPYVNMGSIRNKGLEFTLNATPVLIGNFEWSLNGNISFNRNQIISIDPSGLSDGEIFLSRNDVAPTKVEYFAGSQISSSTTCKDFLNIFIAGQPMALFYGMPTDGLLKEGEIGLPLVSEDGTRHGAGGIKYIDTDGDGVITINDRCIIGNPNPDFVFGFGTSFRYKKLTFSASFSGSFGNDIFSQQEAILSDVSTDQSNRLTEATLHAWTPENTGAWYPAVKEFVAEDVAWITDRFVHDGSYIRLADVGVSYDFSFKKKKSFIQGIKVGVSGRNIFCWTHYDGYDPEINSYGSIKKYGVDMGAYPGSRGLLFDLKFTF